ncbi:unnamed protein product [Mucor hiemalis]
MKLQMNIRNNNEAERQQSEVLQLREKLKDRERELIHIKKELYKYKEQPVDHQQKRLFPGFNVYDKPKVKKISSKPSPFANAAASFSQSRASLSMSSQATSTLSENTLNDKASVRMPMLTSLASPMISPISNTKEVVNVRAEPEVPITRSSIPPDDPPSLTENPPLPDQPKKIRRPTETENKQKLFVVLLTPHFQQWNATHHNNNKDINTALSRLLTKQLSEEFSQQFIPDPSQSPPQTEYERLQLLASDVNNSILKGDSTDNTIRLLLNIFNLTLKIAIKCKLYKIIHTIANVTYALTGNFTIARKYLQRDVAFDANSSLLVQFTKSLALFPFYEPQCPELLSLVGEHRDLSFSDIDRLTTTFNMKPSQIYKDLHSPQSTDKALVIVKSILELFFRVGSDCKKPIFLFLLTNSSFLNLLHHKRPNDIISLSLSVLETGLTNDPCLDVYSDNSLQVLHALTDLISTSATSLETIQWYNICIKALALLELILASELPYKLAIEASKLVLEKVNEAMDSMLAGYLQNSRHLTDTISNKRADFVRLGLETIYSSIKWCPANIFKYTEDLKASSVLDMVDFIQNNIAVDPSLRRTLTRLVTLLNKKEKRKRPEK